MNADCVAIRIEDDCHKANRRFHWLDAKLDSCSLQFRNRRVEMLDFQSDPAAVELQQALAKADHIVQKAVDKAAAEEIKAEAKAAEATADDSAKS